MARKIPRANEGNQSGGQPNEERHFQGAWVPADIFILVEQGVITPTDVWVWLNVAAFQRAGRECYITNETLGQRMNLQGRQTRNIIQKLIEAGLVVRVFKSGVRYLKVSYRSQAAKCGLGEGGKKLPPPGNKLPPLGGKKLPQKDTKRKEELSRPGGGTECEGKFRRMAERLCRAISSVRRVNCTSKLHSWAKAFRLLHTVDGVDVPRLKRVLKWYCAELPTRLRADRYFPVAESATAFREKFTKIEDAMARAARAAGEEPDGLGGEDDGPAAVNTGEIIDMGDAGFTEDEE